MCTDVNTLTTPGSMGSKHAETCGLPCFASRKTDQEIRFLGSITIRVLGDSFGSNPYYIEQSRIEKIWDSRLALETRVVPTTRFSQDSQSTHQKRTILDANRGSIHHGVPDDVGSDENALLGCRGTE
eukprot:scaffold15108_cov180-Amphora_coffeaeformis.AAC.35